ncbi:hypothetical protein AAVH_39602 [Aphelenchoides avenae]|nr:hypothetical protein AAVH_39602 [Aphelenchus avenae]
MAPDDVTWIGLQLSAKGHGGIYYNITDGTTRKFTEGHVEGWWEDGTPYDAKTLKSFWAAGQPDEEPHIPSGYQPQIVGACNTYANVHPWLPHDYNLGRCYADRFQHCAQIFPSGSIAACKDCIASNVGKWSDNWCYFRQRGYICQRDAKPNPDFYAVEGRCVPSDPSSALLRL